MYSSIRGSPRWQVLTEPSLALLWGLAVGLAVAVGQLIAFVLFLAQGANGSYGPYLRLGAVYVELFHRVGLEVRALPLGDGPPLSVGLGLGLLLIPSAAVAVPGLAGRRIARSSPAGTGAMALVAGVIGTLSVPVDARSGSSGHAPAANAVRGGVRAFALGLLLSMVGVLVLASVRPSPCAQTQLTASPGP